MFATVDVAPPDPILGLTEAFARDTNPAKINLGVGVYKDAFGRTPILESVKAAERKLIESESTKGYLPIEGSPAYAAAVQGLLFGKDNPVVAAERCATTHTPGGTGGLRVVGDYLHRKHPGATLWLSDPTWANHPAIFAAANVPTKTYAYFDAKANGLAFDAMLADLQKMPVGDVVLLHGCCHNPTGVDPTDAQWDAAAKVLAERQLVPLLDFAYQGFADGISEDAACLRALARHVKEMFICSSFSKNFGLYNERVGALTVVAATADEAAAVQSQIKVCVRTNYSNPPSHGGMVVQTVLADAALTSQWQGEVAAMRKRINGMRTLFAESLDKRGVKLNPAGNGFIAQQRGMFSFSGLSKEQVEKLRKEHAIYIVGSGRINVAGMSEQNMDRLCDALAAVVA